MAWARARPPAALPPTHTACPRSKRRRRAATRETLAAEASMTTDLRQVWLRLAAAAVLALPGCAYLQGQVAADSEEMLTQAGFQRYPLEEPGLPSRQLVEDAGTYKFADPDFCRCVYTGGAKQY